MGQSQKDEDDYNELRVSQGDEDASIRVTYRGDEDESVRVSYKDEDICVIVEKMKTKTKMNELKLERRR